jgi:hypothetical protein
MLTGKIDTRKRSEPVNLPAPVGGLNGRDPKADMPATDAYEMYNMVPGTTSVKSRNGAATLLAPW